MNKVNYKRRRGPDLKVKIFRYLSAGCWVLILTILLALESARPQFESFFDRFYNIRLRTWWDIEVLYYLLYISISGVIISIAGAFIMLDRSRRKTDRFPLQLAVTMVVSLLGIIYFIRFHDAAF